MEWNIGLLVSLYVIAALSIMGSLFVTISICKFGHSRVSTKLVLYLHIGQIIQDVVALPLLYTHSDVLCKIAGFLHMYSGLLNIMVVAIMGIIYRHIFFPDRFGICAFSTKWCKELVYLCPLVALLPFITNSYGDSEHTFCSLKQNSPFYIIIPGLALIVGGISLFLLIMTTVSVFRKDAEMGHKILKSIGLYAISTIIFWIPRVYLEMSRDYNDVSIVCTYLLVYLSGTAYCFIFCREKAALKLFEKSNRMPNSRLNSETDSESHIVPEDLIYSWEEEEDHDERTLMQFVDKNGFDAQQRLISQSPSNFE